MSIDLSEAYKIASGAIGYGNRVTSAREGCDHWFFCVGNDVVDSIPDLSPIVIDKETGEASYPMPPVPSDVFGTNLLPIEVEVKTAKRVNLPS